MGWQAFFTVLSATVLAVVLAAILAAVARSLVTPLTVFEHQGALLYRSGRYQRLLGPGRHRLWRPWLHETATLVDLRQRSLVVGGQEIPTKDQVGVKVSTIVQLQVTDPCAALHKVESHEEAVHQEVQLALRARVAALTLDELLAAKADLGTELTQAVQARCAEFGLAIKRVDLRDVVLPAAVKAAASRVVEAEKAARAALVTAREELAAARAQANTAKLLQENPLVLRLKELQTLAELAKAPGHAIVFAPSSDLGALLRAATGKPEGGGQG